MALKLETELPIGVVADYWRIIDLSFDYQIKEAKCVLGLYVSKEAREKGAQILQIAEFTFSGDDFDALQVADDAREKAYELCKQPKMQEPQPYPDKTFDPTPVNVNPFVNAEDY